MSLPLADIRSLAESNESIDPAACPSVKRGRGKPTLYTAQLSQTILQDIEQGVPKTKAYMANGISLQTGYDWEKAHPEFAQAVKCAREKFRASWRPRSRTNQGQRASPVAGDKLIGSKFDLEGAKQHRTNSKQARATLTIVLPSKQLQVGAS